MAIYKRGIREGPYRCERCGRFFKAKTRFNGALRKFCKCPDCIKERSRSYKRAYARRLYHSSAAMAGKLNQRTVASRKKSKERLKAETEAEAKAKVEREALERKAAEEA